MMSTLRGVFVALVVVSSATVACRQEEASRVGLVSAATPEAAEAGAEILEAGGNAVDAAVAVAFALGVTEPAGSGLGGQGMLLLHPPASPPVVVLGSSVSPQTVPEQVTAQDLRGHRAATVPSLVAALDVAFRKYGSGELPWARLLEPAIRLAEEGIQLGPFRRNTLARAERALGRDSRVASLLLGARRELIEDAQAVWRQPEQARTLRRLAEHGAGDFYHGQIARRIAADMQAAGGWLTLADLQSFPEPAVVPALEGTYRDWDVYTLPPPAGGWVVIQALNVLEQVAPEALRPDDERRIVWLAETLRAVHGNRLGAPVTSLEDYEAGVERRTSKQTARQIARQIEGGQRGETTHFSIVDAQGFAVAGTQSLNSYFGARALAGGLGFLYNDYMHEFQLDDPGHSFALRGGGVPYSSMSATILAKEGQPQLVLGSPGSRRIISAVIQVISAWADGRLPIDKAVAQSRIHVVPEDEELLVEHRPRSRRELRELEARGFRLSIPLSSLFTGQLDPYFGGVHAVALERGGWRGAADPRRDGAVRPVVGE